MNAVIKYNGNLVQLSIRDRLLEKIESLKRQLLYVIDKHDEISFDRVYSEYRDAQYSYRTMLVSSKGIVEWLKSLSDDIRFREKLIKKFYTIESCSKAINDYVVDCNNVLSCCSMKVDGHQAVDSSKIRKNSSKLLDRALNDNKVQKYLRVGISEC